MGQRNGKREEGENEKVKINREKAKEQMEKQSE